MAAETKNTKVFYKTEVPSDWEVKELGKIAIVNMGQSPNSENYNEIEDGLPLIQGNADIRNRKSFKRYFTTQLTKVCDEGDLILSVRAPVGSIGEASYKSCIGRGVCALKPNKVDKEYLFQLLLNSEDKWKKIEQGSTFTAVSSDDVRKFKLLVPKNEAEQKAIAKVLSTADAAIQATEKLIAQKELRKKWLMQQLLTGKKRLKGFDGEWKSEILGNVVNLQHGYQFRDDDFVEEGIPVIKIRNVIGYDLVLTDMTFVDSRRLEEFKSVVIENGDLLMSLTGNIGRVVEVKGIDKPMFQNYRVGKFTPIDKQVTKALLKFILSSDILYRQFNGLANQSAQANFGKQDMDKLKFSFPISIEEQTAIAQVLQAADKEITLLKAKAEKLREQKKGLMQQLLTGKVRLKID
jgi:type I restriction enzyme S subunit